LKSPIEILDLKRTKHAIAEEAPDGDQRDSPKVPEMATHPGEKQRKHELNKIDFNQKGGISPVKELEIGEKGNASHDDSMLVVLGP
jgi:hypothetical protein